MSNSILFSLQVEAHKLGLSNVAIHLAMAQSNPFLSSWHITEAYMQVMDKPEAAGLAAKLKEAI